MTDRVPGSYGPRAIHIEHAALGRTHGDRRERAGVVRNIWRHQAFDAKRGVSEAIVVDDIDSIPRRRRRSVEVNMYSFVGYRQGRIQYERLFIPVHRQLIAIGAFWQGTDAGKCSLA